MPNAYAKHARSIESVQNYLGDACPKFYWNGKLWPILPGGVRVRGDNSPGGFSLDADLMLTVLVQQFGATRPESNETFNYPGADGHEYRILSVRTAPGALQMDIEATDAAQGL